jgi:hypothetical protein
MAPQYDALAVTALRLATDAPLDRAYHVMRFPGRWKEILRQQARARSGREIVTIPITSLNAAITALMPDCVITMTSVGRGNDDQDWLLAHREGCGDFHGGEVCGRPLEDLDLHLQSALVPAQLGKLLLLLARQLRVATVFVHVGLGHPVPQARLGDP